MVSRILAIALLMLVASTQATDYQDLTPRRKAMYEKMDEIERELPPVPQETQPRAQMIIFQVIADNNNQTPPERRRLRGGLLQRTYHGQVRVVAIRDLNFGNQ